ncbi:hypothetical protein BGZ83_008597 [Gryganskiella cystojenkinii]|nr:hypothetical protein BGZ83_008597 [Gryganskiella cystojenkinii]
MDGNDARNRINPKQQEIQPTDVDSKNRGEQITANSDHAGTNTNSTPVPILTSSLTRQGATASTSVSGNANISFSLLPTGRSFPDSSQPQARRYHEYTPSPARSLAHVLESAEAAPTTSHVRRATSENDETGRNNWPASSSVATGTSAVHFIPQYSHRGWQSGSAGGSSNAGAWMMGTSLPDSRFSEFDVVYDDGIRKQRTFSLTTEPDDDDNNDSENDESETNSLLDQQHEGVSINAAEASAAPLDYNGYTGMLQGGHSSSPVRGHFARPGSPRQSTPLLGKNSGLHHHTSDPAFTGRYHLPPQPPSGPFSFVTRPFRSLWYNVSEIRISTDNKRILKASVAYFLACLLSFIPWFRPYIGASGHLAASSAVFFNPAKSLGQMVEAATAGLCAISFGVVVSVVSMLSAIWFNQRDLYIWGHVVSVVVFGGGSTFVIAYAKAHYNRPTVNVACTLSHIMIMIILTKEGALSLGDFSLTRVLAITTSMLLGVVITVLDMGKSLSSFRLLLKLLTKTFLLEADTSPFGSEPVQRLIESQVKSFSALAKSLEEAQLEYPGTDIKKYEECVKSLNTLAQYLNGLRSSCGLQYDMLKKDELRKGEETQRQPVGSGAGVSTPAAGLTGNGGVRGTLGMGMRSSSYSLLGSLHSDQDQSASDDLIEFLDHVGKPMKSLALTCKLTIEHLQDIFTSSGPERKRPPLYTGGQNLNRSYLQSRDTVNSQQHRQSGFDSTEATLDPTNNARATRRPSWTPAAGLNNSGAAEGLRRNPSLVLMQVNLARALDIFETANSKALKRFYSHQNKRQSGILKRSAGSQPQQHTTAGVVKRMSEPSFQELLAGSTVSPPASASLENSLTEKAPVGEQIFLVYFFVFNLMEFSKELAHLVSCVEVLVDGDEGLRLWIERNRLSWWRRIWFSLTGFPRRLRRPKVRRDLFDSFDEADPESGLRTPVAHSLPTDQFRTASAAPNGSAHHAYQTSGPNNSATPSRDSSHRGRRRKQRLFPKPNIHNKTNTLHTPTPSTTIQRLSTRLWKFLHIFRSFKFKYAMKAAISAMILLVPAFVDLSRPYFVQYRGEWALISMLIIMVPTVGGTNVVGIYRIMGTVLGCYAGVAVYLAFPAHEIMLPICCFLFAVPNFYLVLCSSYPRIGQVTLLAFNLVLIQTYNRRHGDGTVPPDDDEDDDDEVKSGMSWPFYMSGQMTKAASGVLGGASSAVGPDHLPNDPAHISDVWTIAFHRAVAVSIGVIIGVGVTSYVWPYEARVELRKGLSDLLLNISWLYNRLVSVYSTNLDRVSILPQEDHYQQSRSRFRALLRKTTFQERFQTSPQERGEADQSKEEDSTETDIEKMNREFMAIELSLQLQLLRLYALLEETPNEPRLKGKFPVGTYKSMLGSCQNILDRFLSMRLVITKDQWLESARRDFIVPVNKERREMVGNVLLYFYTIASALRLKTPLPPYLPPANRARLRLIQKIRQLPVVQNKVVLTEENDERYIFYYAYALVMEDVIRELERLGQWSQDLFGVITPALEFEGWFTDDGHPPDTPATPDMRDAEIGSSGGYFKYGGARASRTVLSSSTNKGVRSDAQNLDQSNETASSGVRSLSKPLLVSTPGKYRYSPDNNHSRGLPPPHQQRYAHQHNPSDDGQSTHSVDELNIKPLNDQRSDFFTLDPQESSVNSHRGASRGPSFSNEQEGFGSGTGPTLPPPPMSRPRAVAPRRSQSLTPSATSLHGERRDYGAISTAPALSRSGSSGGGGDGRTRP